MPKIVKRNTVIMGVSVMPRHKELIDHLMVDKGTFKSASEVVQRAIEFFHDKTYPDYVYNKSATDVFKRKQLKAQIELETMPDEDFCNKYFAGAPILPGSEGKLYFLTHRWGNAVTASLLSEVRDVISKFPDLPEYHETSIKERGPVLEYLKTSPSLAQMITNETGIVFNE